jgi:hypothetical protein
MNLSSVYPGMGQVEQPPVPSFYEETFQYVFQISLTSNQVVKEQRQTIDRDADFIWTAIWGTQTGAYSIQFRDAQGRIMSSGEVRNVNAVGTAQFPVPLMKPRIIPGGGFITMNLTELSGAGNTIELVFGGFKRFKTAR